jgi:hypothetical protein
MFSFVTKGIAQEWKESAMPELDETINEVARRTLYTDVTSLWGTYKEMFRDQWRTHSNKEEQQHRLQHLRQGNDTVEQYKIKFANASKETGYEEQALITYFKQGLKEVIKMRIYASGNVPTTLEEWKTRATIIDAAWREGELNRIGPRKFTPRANVRAVTIQQGQRRPRLPDEEYERRKKEKLCFKCAKPGHMANKCFSQARTMEIMPTDEPTEDTQDFQ